MAVARSDKEEVKGEVGQAGAAAAPTAVPAVRLPAALQTLVGSIEELSRKYHAVRLRARAPRSSTLADGPASARSCSSGWTARWCRP